MTYSILFSIFIMLSSSSLLITLVPVKLSNFLTTSRFPPSKGLDVDLSGEFCLTVADILDFFSRQRFS